MCRSYFPGSSLACPISRVVYVCLVMYLEIRPSMRMKGLGIEARLIPGNRRTPRIPACPMIVLLFDTRQPRCILIAGRLLNTDGRVELTGKRSELLRCQLPLLVPVESSFTQCSQGPGPLPRLRMWCTAPEAPS